MGIKTKVPVGLTLKESAGLADERSNEFLLKLDQTYPVWESVATPGTCLQSDTYDTDLGPMPYLKPAPCDGNARQSFDVGELPKLLLGTFVASGKIGIKKRSSFVD